MANGLGMLGIAAGSTAVGQGLGMINQNRQAELNKRQAKYQQSLDKEMMKYSYDLTNTTAQMRQLKNNNLNPTLALGNGGGNTIVSTGNSGTQGVGMIQPEIDPAAAANIALIDAQKENIEADTKLKESNTVTNDQSRPYIVELEKQKGVKQWLENNRTIFMDRTSESGSENTWNYNEILDKEHTIESGSLFGRQVTQDVLKTVAETGNLEAKTILTNKEAQNLFRRILNETIIAEAAKQNSDTDRENLANERIKAEAAKLTAEYGAGEIMNTTKVIELAAKIISSLPIGGSISKVIK